MTAVLEHAAFTATLDRLDAALRELEARHRAVVSHTTLEALGRAQRALDQAVAALADLDPFLI